MELINKVESVSKVGNTARVAAEQKNSSSESFEQILALEQSRQKARVRRADERPVNVNPDVLNGRMNGYNNKAREAYFSMVFPTMDLKGYFAVVDFLNQFDCCIYGIVIRQVNRLL